MNSDDLLNLREALKLSPENKYLRVLLVDGLLKAKAFDEAMAECLVLLAMDSRHVPYQLKLALCYSGKGDNSTCIVILEEILEAQPTQAEALALLSRSYLKEKEISKASVIYQKLKKANPAFSDEELDRELTLKYGDADTNAFIDEVEQRMSQQTKNKIKFTEVGGMEKEKEEIRMKIIHPIAHADLYKAYGKKTGGGILFYGPPGCGKTFLARATAGEIDSEFISVGINDILDMYIGNSEKQLHDIFEKARALAPCVLFFDEVDALGANRNDLRASAGRNVINQFLAELDGIEGNNDGVLVMGATNAPWHLDPAFRRPGRFDRIIFVQPPDEESRKAILRVSLEGKPMESVDFDKIARQTKEFSGADIKALIDLTVEEKIKQAMKQGTPSPISTKDLVNAAEKVKPSTKEWFVSARNYALYSNESGIYDEILEYLKIKK